MKQTDKQLIKQQCRIINSQEKEVDMLCRTIRNLRKMMTKISERLWAEGIEYK